MEKNHHIECVGFIMDGNRRFAKAQGKPSLEGHRAGYEALKSLITSVHSRAIPHMVCYAFSTENWSREVEEVSYLMKLMGYALSELRETLQKDARKINLRVIGERARLPESLIEEIEKIESEAHEHPELTVWVALSYGGRAEIVDAVNQAVHKGEKVTEEVFEKLLWTADMPDPDIIVRTGGDMRISNFLLWKASYSELFFTDTLWPDFGETEFQSILDEYERRERRRGA